MEFKIESDFIDGIPTIRLKGEIDVHTAPQINRQLESLVTEGRFTIILDLEHVHYIDSIGLGTIAHAAHAVLSQNGKILVISTRPHVHKLFNVSGPLRKNVVLVDTESAALKSA